ncbi:DHA1 family bicyclomycin/chloramphenicol resistance-like MFS transporter [Actinomycetospora succinea]|uniref:DHA1 family bicyclomycin/chloramphenicol resistance-like MFS transporter n=1 Tax=Actinomycetospora succinea TaxID=663603 RepID=A0A4V6PWU5_9PSEU|nr:multidrug effflux MFS transporter [Actinomycetospora succinea]TDQ51727.1 DHA1 family bicyclomycin/chloramphenicol resistance-like MFS transporter [Actinomycetospora succinea]
MADDGGRADPVTGHRARLVVLGALTAAAPLSLDTYLPALPTLTADLATTPSVAQLSLTSCLVGLALGQLVAGPLSDVLGRRRPMLIGAAGFAVASVLCAVAPSVEVLIALRLAQGLLGAVGIVVARAVVRDTSDATTSARAFATLMLVSGVAPIVAPVLGGQLLRVTSWRGVFVVLAVYGALTGLAVLGLVRESLPRSRRRAGSAAATLASFRVLLGDRRVVACVLAAGLVFSAMFAYISGSTFVLQDLYGLSPQAFSGVFAANSVAIVTSVQVAGRLAGSGRVRPERLLVTGLGVALVGTGGLLVSTLLDAGLAGLLAGLVLTVIGVGFVLPCATTLALADHPEHAGSASALLGTSQFLVGAGTAPLVGLAGSRSAVPMAATMAGAVLLGAVVFGILWRGALPERAEGAQHN